MRMSRTLEVPPPYTFGLPATSRCEAPRDRFDWATQTGSERPAGTDKC
jgi:hypothetical protein